MAVIVIAGVGATLVLFPPLPIDESAPFTILTFHDAGIYNAFELAFLESEEAIENGIDDIEWITPRLGTPEEYIRAGMVDIIWGSKSQVESLATESLLESFGLNMSDTLESINNSIAGTSLKGYNQQGELVWVGTSLSVVTHDLLVNTTLLEQKNLPIPKSWSDLANTTYNNETGIISHVSAAGSPTFSRIYDLLTQTLGWENGWVTMTGMVGNSKIFDSDSQAMEALSNGSVGIVLYSNFGPYEQGEIPEGVEIIHSKDQSIVRAEAIAISSTSMKKDIAERFIEFVLSAEGQALWLDDTFNRVPINVSAFDIRPDATIMHDFFVQTVNDSGIIFNETASFLVSSALTHYFDSTIYAIHDNITRCWTLLASLYDNGTINVDQLEYFTHLLGTPLRIVDPLSHIERIFDFDYAIEVSQNLLTNQTYTDEVWELWNSAASARCTSIYNDLALL